MCWSDIYNFFSGLHHKKLLADFLAALICHLFDVHKQHFILTHYQINIKAIRIAINR